MNAHNPRRLTSQMSENRLFLHFQVVHLGVFSHKTYLGCENYLWMLMAPSDPHACLPFSGEQEWRNGICSELVDLLSGQVTTPSFALTSHLELPGLVSSAADRGLCAHILLPQVGPLSPSLDSVKTSGVAVGTFWSPGMWMIQGGLRFSAVLQSAGFCHTLVSVCTGLGSVEHNLCFVSCLGFP